MSDRGYTDPQLWIRLGPKLRELLTDSEEKILQKRVATYEDYANTMGYIRGLRDVFKIAEDLQRIEPREERVLPPLDRADRRRDAKEIWGMMD